MLIYKHCIYKYYHTVNNYGIYSNRKTKEISGVLIVESLVTNGVRLKVSEKYRFYAAASLSFYIYFKFF